MTVEDALEFFENHSENYRKLQTIVDVGLRLYQLGQPATTFQVEKHSV